MITEKKQQLIERISYGVLPAMATPIASDGQSVNMAVLEALIDFLITARVKGLFVGGTTGEGILLTLNQRQALHEQAMKVIAGRVPALLHVGANTTAESVQLARHAQSIGADAIVAVTPTFYPVPDPSLAVYFRELAAAAPDTPLMAYDIPHMAINGVSPALLADLAHSLPSFAGIKTSNSDAQAIRRLIDAAPPDGIVLAGNERIALGSLAMGAAGLISGLSTALPEPFVRLTDAFFAGDLRQAQQEQKRINSLLDLLPQGRRIGALKSLLIQRGIDVGSPISPRPAVDPEEWPVWPEIAAQIN